MDATALVVHFNQQVVTLNTRPRHLFSSIFKRSNVQNSVVKTTHRFRLIITRWLDMFHSQRSSRNYDFRQVCMQSRCWNNHHIQQSQFNNSHLPFRLSTSSVLTEDWDESVGAIWCMSSMLLFGNTCVCDCLQILKMTAPSMINKRRRKPNTSPKFSVFSSILFVLCPSSS